MRLSFNIHKLFLTFIFLSIAANAFFSGFKDLEISQYFFYFVVMLIFLLHLVISRIDFIFIIGCILVIFLKATGLNEEASDAFMVFVLSWGLSFIRPEYKDLHFNLILIYGLVTIIVGLLQILGIEQFHLWNTFMFDENIPAKPILYTPIEYIGQAQIRPPGLFHNANVLTLFVVYFYALTLNKSMRYLPLGLLLVWISGSKIALVFIILYPLIMIFCKSRFFSYDYLKIYLITIIFLIIMWIISPEIHIRRWDLTSFFPSVLFRLISINEFFGYGYDLNSIEMYREDEVGYFTRLEDEVGLLTGALSFLLIFLPLALLSFLRMGLKKTILLVTKKNSEFFSLSFVSLATPIMGDPFVIIILYPILYALRAGKRKSLKNINETVF